MAGPPLVLTPEEIARQQAAAEASAYLASQGVGGYTPASAPVSMEPPLPPGPQASVAPPPPPPPPGPSPAWENAKRVATGAAGALLGPLAAGAEYGRHQLSSADAGAQPPPPAPKQAPEAATPSGAEDDELILDPRRLGRPGVVVPAGMYPHSMVTSKKLGKEVPAETRRALGAATGLELDAAQKERDAAQEFYRNTRGLHEAQLRATSDAAASHAAVQAKRDAEVSRRLSEIEALNKQAQTKPEDLWGDKQALAGMLGTIASVLGGIAGASGATSIGIGAIAAGNLANRWVNQDIEAKLAARKSAGDAAQRQTDLLGHYLQKFGQEDKAIDATRLAYADSILQMMETYKAQHAGQVSEAKYQQMQAEVLNRRAEVLNKLHAQETDDVAQQYSEQWQNARVLGGAGGMLGDDYKPGHTVVLPPSDATGGKSVRVGLQDAPAAERLQKESAFVGRITDINNRAIELRKQLSDARRSPSMQTAHKAANAYKELRKLEQEKSKLLSSKDAQGVLKEAEYLRTMDIEVGLTNIDILSDTGKLLRRENEHMTKGLQQSVKAAGGSEVRQGFVRDRNGALKKIQLEKGRLYEPEVIAPEVDDEVE